MKGGFPSTQKSPRAAYCQLSLSCFMSFSVISLPGQGHVQMFIHQPQCLEVSRVSQIITLMLLYGSMSNRAEPRGCSHSSQGMIKAPCKCHYTVLPTDEAFLEVSFNWRGAASEEIIASLTAWLQLAVTF